MLLSLDLISFVWFEGLYWIISESLNEAPKLFGILLIWLENPWRKVLVHFLKWETTWTCWFINRWPEGFFHLLFLKCVVVFGMLILYPLATWIFTTPRLIILGPGPILWAVTSSERGKRHRAELVENSCAYHVLKTDTVFALRWNILELEIKIIILPVIKFNKELRLYNTVPAGDSNDCYTCTFC